jgi:DNA-binding transcriptional MocR family regulator
LAILIMPTVPFDWKRFFARAEEERIKLYMARERSGGTFEAIRMGFGGFGLGELEEAVAAFGRVWREAVK